MLKSVKTAIAALGFAMLSASAFATQPLDVNISFTPTTAAQTALNLFAFSFQTVDAVSIGQNFALNNLNPSNPPPQYNAGQISPITNIYANGPYELEVYMGGVLDFHAGGVSGTSSSLFTVNGSTASFNIGSYLLPSTYGSSTAIGTITVSDAQQSSIPAPGPIAGAGLPVVLSLLGFLAFRRRNTAAA